MLIKQTWPIISIVFQGDRTRKLRSLGPLVELPPMNHLRKGNIIPAMSRIEVNVFSRIKAAT